VDSGYKQVGYKHFPDTSKVFQSQDLFPLDACTIMLAGYKHFGYKEVSGYKEIKFRPKYIISLLIEPVTSIDCRKKIKILSKHAS